MVRLPVLLQNCFFSEGGGYELNLPTTVPDNTRLSQDFRANRDNKLTNLTAWSPLLCACRADNFRYACPSVRHL